MNNKEKDRGIRIERVPYDHDLNYNQKFVDKRRKWLSEKTGVSFKHISYFSSDTEAYCGNIENFVGVAQVPIGIVGPIKVNGEFSKGTFYVPFATTEGAMVETYQRGAIALTKAGGVNVFVNKDANHLDPIFIFKNAAEAKNFVSWITNNFLQIKEQSEKTTGFGKLISATPHWVGRRVILDLAYYTTDAMGANMINIATEKVCEFIASKIKVEKYLLRSNFSSEKKASAVNLLNGYGKEVILEAILSKKIISRILFSTVEDIYQCWHSWALSSFSSGMLGINAHYANGLAAIFIACGQDVAHVSNASVGITSYEITDSGDLYISLKLPNIIVGTVGGGTALSTQTECLKMIGCYGKDKAKKFAEIIGAALMAGELGICAGLTTKHFLDPHKRAREHTRLKAYKEQKDKE
jgi:hydroxymethylglutaryl-CoA reductase (NADPH)